MSTRYFVRTVNHNTLQEHFVVADFRQGGACINVYFNRPAALNEARRLNRAHHRQQLDGMHQLDSWSFPPESLNGSLAETIASEPHLDATSSPHWRIDGSQAPTSPKPGTPLDRTSKQVAEDLMKHRLVR